MATKEDVESAKLDRQEAKVRRQKKMDVVRDWTWFVAGGVSLPFGLSEVIVPELIPVVLADPITAPVLVGFGVTAFFGRRVYDSAAQFFKKMED